MNSERNKRGAFVSLEGIEGAGKSSSLKFIQEYLDEHSIPWIETREPGGTPLAERIRRLVLQTSEQDLDTPTEKTEALLMFASRAQHIGEVIAPALNAGKWVLCDRFTDSTLAYQGAARELGMTSIKALAEWVHPNLWPDLTLLLDVSVSVGFKRIEKRGEKDRMESERAEFFEKVRAGYLQLAEENPERIKLIDAYQNRHNVDQSLAKVLDQFRQQWSDNL